MTSKKIMSGSLAGGNNEINLELLSRGTYIFQIISDEGSFYYRLIKQ
jgi:hypothetical protein